MTAIAAIANAVAAGRNLADATPTELHQLAAWLTATQAAVAAEQARRREITDRAARAAAWRTVTEDGDDPRWTPQAGDGARICAGPDSGWRGTVVGRCTDGCEEVDGRPRWWLHNSVAGFQTCITRAHLRPVPTVRRPGSAGRARCAYDCRCCMDVPRRHLTEPAGSTPANH